MPARSFFDPSPSKGGVRRFVAIAAAFFLLAISIAGSGTLKEPLAWVGPFGAVIAAFCFLAKAGEIRASKTGKTALRKVAVTGAWGSVGAFVFLAAMTILGQLG